MAPFLYVPVAPLLMPGKELRVQDYLKAYQTTGRYPFPCPQSPDTPSARAAIGLPPLFVPAAIPVPSDSLSSMSSSSDPAAALPANHEFRSTRTITGEHFECISAQTLYNHFSHEVGFPSACSHCGYFPLFIYSHHRSLALSPIPSLCVSITRWHLILILFFLLLVRSS